MDLKTDRGRVQFTLALYLSLFFLLNIMVWSWFVVHRHGPHHFPLGERVERFGDLLRFTAKYQIGKDPRMADGAHMLGTLYPKNYPPLSVNVYLFLLQVCAPYALPVLLTVTIAGFLAACILLWRRVRTASAYRWYVGAAIFATGLLGWGSEEVIMRGNIEGLLWIAVAMGAFLFYRRRYTGSGVWFGIACCLKPQAVLWLALVARQRKYRLVVISFIAAVLVTLASLLIINRNPVRAYEHITGKSSFFDDYVVSFRPIEEAKGDHSLLQSIKMVSRIIRFHGLNFPTHERVILQSNNPLARKLYYAYLPIAAAIGLFVLWRVWNKPVLNQMFALACISTVLPMIAADYTLTVLLIPLGFFLIHLLEDVAEGRTQLPIARQLWFLLPTAWIMGIEPLWVIHGVLKCAAVLSLLWASISIPLPTTAFGELRNAKHRAVLADAI